jgi:hypothetical protein
MGPHVTKQLEPLGPHEQGPLETTGVTVAGYVNHGLLNVAPYLGT